MTSQSNWLTGPDVWAVFIETHPELGYKNGRQQFHNFLRRHKHALVNHDALRRAKGKFWIGHRDRFCDVAFELATGKTP